MFCRPAQRGAWPKTSVVEDDGLEMLKKIPFNAPYIVGKELFYISQAVLEGNLAGDGRFTKACHEWLEKTFHAKKALLTTSCTCRSRGRLPPKPRRSRPVGRWKVPMRESFP